MTRPSLLLIAAAFGTVAAPALAERESLAVVTAGSDQALKLGPTILSRPFGGELVDRIAVSGRYALPGGETAWLVRGDGAADCPTSYIVVSSRRDEPPAVSAPFGACLPLSTVTVRGGALVVGFPGPAGPVAFAWSQGAVHPVGPALEAAAPPPSACSAEIDKSPELLDAAIDQTLTPDLRNDSGVRRADLDSARLQLLVSDLACLSGWPGADRKLYEAATPLFASKRYGHAAFGALDTVARTPGADVALRAAVRRFSAQMYYFVAAQQPL